MREKGIWKILVILMVLVMIGSCATMPSAGDVSESEVKSSSATIYVPDDYPTIQEAVNGASTGDTIIVRDGIYIENVEVDKRLTIRSENGSDSTIVQAEDPGDNVFSVTADYVEISGFTVEAATWRWTNGGCVDKGNGGSSCFHCSIPWKLFVAGIYLHYADYCNISNNKCSNSGRGIALENSNNNCISNNTCSNNEKDSIRLLVSRNNKLKGNIMVGNGIYIRGYSLRDYTHEIDESNTVKGKPVYYWKGVEGGRIPDGAGQVILVNCTNITIENQNLNNASVGMEVAYSSFITIKNNTCSNNNKGIYLVHSNKNRISNNNFINDTDNVFPPVSTNALNPTLKEITPSIELLFSDNNLIYLNNFINNTVNPSVSTNAWNSTEEITYIYRGTTYTNYLGNYWNDYEGTDADGDGIGDTPYIRRYSIQSIEKDKCPLMQPWQNYFPGENDFINNTNNAYSYDSNNIWNSTEKITYIYNGGQCTNYIGNYWGGYKGKYPAAEETDSTGIWWDTPHGINSDKDYYPLMDRAENYFVSTENFFRAGNVICNCGKN